MYKDVCFQGNFGFVYPGIYPLSIQLTVNKGYLVHTIKPAAVGLKEGFLEVCLS